MAYSSHMPEIAPFVSLEMSCAAKAETLVTLMTKDYDLELLDIQTSLADSFETIEALLAVYDEFPKVFGLEGADIGKTSYRSFVFAYKVARLIGEYAFCTTVPRTGWFAECDASYFAKIQHTTEAYLQANQTVGRVLEAFAAEIAWGEEDYHFSTVQSVGGFTCMIIDLAMHESYMATEVQRLQSTPQPDEQ